MNINLGINVVGHVKITDEISGEILRDQYNACNPANIARVIARALAHEPNYQIYRIAYGNGGTAISADGSISFNPPNVNSWSDRLYNETYSEVLDKSAAAFGTDIGSSDSSTTRTGGGADPDDPAGGGVTSQEVGLKSNILIIDYINENEPSGQALTSGATPSSDQKCFSFDEIGLYSPGKPAKSSNGYTTVNVGNKTSDDIATALIPNSVLTFTLSINGTSYTTQITTPETGSGLVGDITYGDLCEGLNTGAWITGGDDISGLLFTYITDNSSGTYPTILNKQSYGFLVFQSRTVGSTSTVHVTCNASSPTDLFNLLTGSVCANCNVMTLDGKNAGVQNDPIHPENERERLLTHFIMEPLFKSSDRIFKIEYTLTISVAPTQDSTVEIVQN